MSAMHEEELNDFQLCQNLRQLPLTGEQTKSTLQLCGYDPVGPGLRQSKEGTLFPAMGQLSSEAYLVDGYTINRKQPERALHAVVKDALSRSTRRNCWLPNLGTIFARNLAFPPATARPGQCPIPRGKFNGTTYEDAMLFIPVDAVYCQSLCVCELLRSWCRKYAPFGYSLLCGGACMELVFRVDSPVQKNNQAADYGQ